MSASKSKSTTLDKKDTDDLVDITSMVDECASSMTFSDPFLCDEHAFSLQDSMAALELMDPVMDCCEIPASSMNTMLAPDVTVGDVGGDCAQTLASSKPPRQRTVPPRNGPKGLDDVFFPLPWDDLTLGDARAIGAETLTRLESMLGGACVAESTYTCLYAHDPVLLDMRSRLSFPSVSGVKRDGNDALRVVNPATNDPGKTAQEAGKGNEEGNRKHDAAPQQYAVYAMALGLVKLSEVVRTIVQHADIYEEEDFSVNAYSFRFCAEVDENDVPVALTRAMKELGPLLDGDDKEDVSTLLLMLGFQFDFFRACTSLAKLTSATVKDVAEKTKGIVKSGVEKLEKLRSAIDSLSDSGSNKKPAGTDENPLLRRSFDPYVNRTLLGNAPVRKVKFKKPVDSVSTLVTIFSELNWAVCDLILRGSTLGRIKRMLNHVSVSSVNILSRSFIVLNLYFDDLLLGQFPLAVLIAQNMNQIGGVPRALTDSQYGRTFLNRLGKPIYDTLKLLVLNRNRQRAYMEAIMMREWAALQREAGAVDYYFRDEHKLNPRTSPFVTNYVLSITVWLMEHYIGLAIELRLFHGHHDLAIAFWYWDFLLSTLMNTMTAMRKAKVERRVMEAQILREQEEAAAAAEKQKGKKRGGKGHGKKTSNGSGGGGKRSGAKAATAASVFTATAEDAEDNIDYMLVGLRRTLCRGLVRFIAALNQAELLRPPKYQFTSHARRFEKRFELFTLVRQPPVLSYDDFLKGSDFSAVVQSDLLSSATDCFKASKAVIDKMLAQLGDVDEDYLPISKEETMNLAKVCVGNMIFLHKLTQQVQNGGKASGEVSFDFQRHKQFCSINIT